MENNRKLNQLFLAMDDEDGFPLLTFIEPENTPHSERARVRIMRENHSQRNLNLAAKGEDVLIFCCESNFFNFFSHVLTVMENARQEDDNWRLALHAWFDSELKECAQFNFDF